MKVLVLVSLIAVASARPDIGLLYRQQGGEYGVNQHHHHHQAPSRTYIPSAPSTIYQTPGNAHHHHQQYTGGNVVSSSTYGSGSSQYRNDYGAQNSYGVQGGSYGVSGQSSFGQASYQQYSGPAQVTKHAYFFDAPEDHHAGHTRVHVPVAPPRQNVKLIFIKAPSYGHSSHIVAPQQQDQEKTLVYVLVKKPGEDDELTIPTPAPTQPSKPEVFFIKYKTQKEAEDKIAGTLQGSHGAAHLASSLDNEGALVQSIGRDASSQHNVNVEYGAQYDTRINGQDSVGSTIFSTAGPAVAVGPTVVTHTEVHGTHGQDHSGYQYKREA